jgi:hypothetical protein
MQAPVTLLCAKCGEATDGWKCAICGSVAREHDPGHLHVGSDRYCALRCAGCARPTSTAPVCSCLASKRPGSSMKGDGPSTPGPRLEG